jgi:hypothetical protein
MPTLDVSKSNQVSSPQVLDVLLGAPQSHLLVFTGIAIPEFASDDNLDQEQVIVKLGKTISNPQIPFQYSATVGLASIGNADSDYTFATDDVSVTADPQSGELQLVCDIAAQGSSILHRFSYQVNVIVQTTVPSISGKIFWRKSVASAVSQFANNLFTVQASIQIPGTPGTFGGNFQKVADGTIIYPPVPAASSFLPDGLVVQYVIENALVNTDLFIICNPVDGAFQATGSLAGTFQCAVLANPSPINLKPPNLHMSDVDFILELVPPPR